MGWLGVWTSPPALDSRWREPGKKGQSRRDGVTGIQRDVELRLHQLGYSELGQHLNTVADAAPAALILVLRGARAQLLQVLARLRDQQRLRDHSDFEPPRVARVPSNRCE